MLARLLVKIAGWLLAVPAVSSISTIVAPGLLPPLATPLPHLSPMRRNLLVRWTTLPHLSHTSLSRRMVKCSSWLQGGRRMLSELYICPHAQSSRTGLRVTLLWDVLLELLSHREVMDLLSRTSKVRLDAGRLELKELAMHIWCTGVVIKSSRGTGCSLLSSAPHSMSAPYVVRDRVAKFSW